MALDFNFFVPLPRELRQYPAARTQRTTLWQKFKDTYYVVAGKQPVLNLRDSNQENVQIFMQVVKPGRLGIVDYVTLAIPKLIAKGLLDFSWFLDRQDIIPPLLSNVPWALGSVVETARALSAAVATVLFSPVVLVTHLIASLVGLRQYNKVLELKDRQGSTLDSWLKLRVVSAHDLRLSHASTAMDSGTKKIVLSLSKKAGTASLNAPPFTFEVPVVQNGNETRFQESSQALLDLNMFKVRSRISEKSSKVDFGNDNSAEEIKTLLGV